MALAFPFTALVGQDEMKRALVLSAVDPGIGGVLIFGDRGTGKSTAVRALAALLQPMRAVVGCPYACAPDRTAGLCPTCRPSASRARNKAKVEARGAETGKAKPPPSTLVAVPVVDLPLGASEDRVVGALDLEKALARGEKAFEPGLLARANRGFLYIDEVNLLEDHLVDLLLDVAASGENLVEREGLSIRHPARFVLIGSGNPEEGELRPQLLDRFGLSVDVRTSDDIDLRVEAVKRREAFDENPSAFVASHARNERKLAKTITAARARLAVIGVPDTVRRQIAGLCLKLGTDGLRGELVLLRAARALAALEGAEAVTEQHLRQIAPAALRHRLRRNPLDDVGSTTRVDRALTDVFGPRDVAMVP